MISYVTAWHLVDPRQSLSHCSAIEGFHKQLVSSHDETPYK